MIEFIGLCIYGYFPWKVIKPYTTSGKQEQINKLNDRTDGLFYDLDKIIHKKIEEESK